MTEDRLGGALSAWAAGHRLESRERERIRTAILLTPQVDALWWDQFNRQMTRIAARAGRTRTGDVASVAGGWANPAM
ncbi:MAG: hypothetical protein J2P38_04520 [Candidatus Dormibacteraeota bacterium]|nr:hypothetical protein [Candidatus Dormibacteraeota bacterium]